MRAADGRTRNGRDGRSISFDLPGCVCHERPPMNIFLKDEREERAHIRKFREERISAWYVWACLRSLSRIFLRLLFVRSS